MVNKYLTKEGLDKQALLVYNRYRKKREEIKTMLNYEDTLTPEELDALLDELAEEAVLEHLMETYGFPL